VCGNLGRRLFVGRGGFLFGFFFGLERFFDMCMNQMAKVSICTHKCRIGSNFTDLNKSEFVDRKFFGPKICWGEIEKLI
jgi:hypothetical protein